MTDVEWVLLKDYASRLEADIDLAAIGDEIPTLVRGGEVGIFGPGFAGATSRGVQVYVPSDALEDAREMIGLD
jgi:hypothetical protein